jgi:Pathogenicity locus
MARKKRRLDDLVSVGPATLRDFERLGIRSLSGLARQNPHGMYSRLNRLTGERQDPCLLDVFCAAVAQARDSRLPAEQCRWWLWSAKRGGLEAPKKAPSRIERRQQQSAATRAACI